MTATEELLPCPFCGGEAIDCEIETGNWRVGCNNVQCRGDWFASKFYPTKADAIKAWNERAQGTCAIDSWGGDSCQLTCGHSAPGYAKFCPECGRRLVYER